MLTETSTFLGLATDQQGRHQQECVMGFHYDLVQKHTPPGGVNSDTMKTIQSQLYDSVVYEYIKAVTYFNFR